MSPRCRTAARRAGIAAWLVVGLARGDVSGFGAGRFDPAERGSTWFTGESLDLRGHLRPAAGLLGDYASRPVTVTANDGRRVTLVRQQATAHLGGAVTLADHVRLGVSVPVAAHATGQSAVVGGTASVAPPSSDLGDVRLGVDTRILGAYGEPFTFALGAQVYLPTGRRESFTGDETLRLQSRALAAGQIGPFVYAARAGVMWRPLAERFAGSALGSELTFGAAAGVKLGGADHAALVLGPELSGSTVMGAGDGAFPARTTPVELLLGAHAGLLGDWRGGLAVGGRVADGYGAPALRLVATLEWAPSSAAFSASSATSSAAFSPAVP